MLLILYNHPNLVYLVLILNLVLFYFFITQKLLAEFTIRKIKSSWVALKYGVNSSIKLIGIAIYIIIKTLKIQELRNSIGLEETSELNFLFFASATRVLN